MAHPAPPAASGFDALDRAKQLNVETPEHVGLAFEIAGMGSRAAAALIDMMIVVTVIIVASISAQMMDVDTGAIYSLGGSLLVFLLFALQAGYFFLFEAFAQGRTPGKRLIGLRVVHDGGVPLSIRGAALRNLVRPVDMQPVGTSLLGLALIGLHSKGQRLGDLAGGTVVVRDRHSGDIPEMVAAGRAIGRPVLDPERFRVLREYVTRREALPKEIRQRLAGRVGSAIGDPIRKHPQRLRRTVDDLLVELYEEEKERQAGGTNLQAVDLVRSQRPSWERYQALIEKGRKTGLGALSESELADFTALYRQLTADLARARSYGASLKLAFELERMVGEGHNLFYRAGPVVGFSPLRWVRSTLPRQVRAYRAYVLMSAFLLFAPSLWVFGRVAADPELGRSLAPPAMVSRAEEAGARLERGEQYVDVPQVMMPLFSSQIMTNNLRVALTTAAGGILAGVGTILILVLNGTHLGSIFALFHHHDAARQLWWFVLPHGILELTAIVLAGAAGLVLASAIFLPGRLTRGDSLREKGSAALSLLAGSLVLLVPAGLVEGFVSPAEIPPPLKMAFAATVGLLLFLYLGMAGREGEVTPEVDREAAGE